MIRTKVAMASVIMFQKRFRSPGTVQKILRVSELSSLESNCNLKTTQHKIPPIIPPVNCPSTYIGNSDQAALPVTAKASVTIGLM